MEATAGVARLAGLTARDRSAWVPLEAVGNHQPTPTAGCPSGPSPTSDALRDVNWLVLSSKYRKTDRMSPANWPSCNARFESRRSEEPRFSEPTSDGQSGRPNSSEIPWARCEAYGLSRWPGNWLATIFGTLLKEGGAWRCRSHAVVYSSREIIGWNCPASPPATDLAPLRAIPCAESPPMSPPGSSTKGDRRARDA